MVAVSLALGILGSYVSTFGLPPFPPRTSGQKFFFVIVLLLCSGLFISGLKPRQLKRLFMVTGAIIVVWLVGPKLLQQPGGFIPLLLGSLLLWIATAQNIHNLRSSTHDEVFLVLCISLGLGALCASSGSLSAAQTAVSITSCVTGLLISAIISNRVYAGGFITHVSFGALLTLSSQTMLYGGFWKYTIFLMFGALYAEKIAFKNTLFGRVLYKLVILIGCLIPALICVLLSFISVSLENPAD